MDTITRREFLTRVLRITVAGPAILGTRAAQENVLFRLWRVFGDSALGHWFGELWTWW